MHVITSADEALDELGKLFEWAERVDFAYAWASSHEGKARHWRRVDQGKLSRALIGTQFAQTEPWVLRELDKVPGRLKLVISGEGTFHPKLAIGFRGRSVRVIVGSSNFTSAAYSTNTELNVRIEGDAEDPEIRRFLRFYQDVWAEGKPLDHGWLRDYEIAWKEPAQGSRIGSGCAAGSACPR